MNSTTIKYKGYRIIDRTRISHRPLFTLTERYLIKKRTLFGWIYLRNHKAEFVEAKSYSSIKKAIKYIEKRLDKSIAY